MQICIHVQECWIETRSGVDCIHANETDPIDIRACVHRRVKLVGTTRSCILPVFHPSLYAIAHTLPFFLFPSSFGLFYVRVCVFDERLASDSIRFKTTASSYELEPIDCVDEPSRCQ